MAEADIKTTDVLKITALASALSALVFFLGGHLELDIADEGYLWYGAVQTALGKVPIRDFQSYDPGRYYWAALWSYALGDGIVALRMSSGFFQAIGLTFGLLSARRVINSYWILALAGCLLAVWMFPSYKFFEPSFSMAGVFFAVRLIEKQTPGRHFAAGVFVGLAAFFGRNLGLYGLLAFSGLTFFLWYKSRTDEARGLVKRYASLGAGVLAGYSPMILMLVAVDGFWDSFIYSIVYLFKIKATNLALPIPLPWSASNLFFFIISLLFLSMPVIYSLSFLWLIFTPKEAVQKRGLLTAATFIGVFYMHYAYSRADTFHLAFSIHPLLLGLISLPYASGLKKKKEIGAAVVFVLLIVAFFSIVQATPFYKKWRTRHYVEYQIRGDSLRLLPQQAETVDRVKRVVSDWVGSDEKLMIVPHWPTMYPVLGRQSPVWQLYFIFREPEEDQRKLIASIKANDIKWVIFGDTALDGRDDLRFRNTNSLVWQYLREEFEPVDEYRLPSEHILLRKKGVLTQKTE